MYNFIHFKILIKVSVNNDQMHIELINGRE